MKMWKICAVTNVNYKLKNCYAVILLKGHWITDLISIFFFFTGKITLERERLAAERKEREQRFELESQERQVILDLLKEKVLKGWRAASPVSQAIF